LEWLNEPPSWEVEDDVITMTAGPRTDFWRTTHYGFVRDNGHLYGRRMGGDFTAEVVVRAAYASQYDQAGLMLRVDAATWIKCGIEFVDGRHFASAVVTRDYSDWSVVPLTGDVSSLRLRVQREDSAVEVRYALGGDDLTLLRIAYFPDGDTLVGPMCAAPDGEGFTATFEGFTVAPG
jgi:regulation of enolase protein 1 (concanavalin A-like superfamily)